MSRSLFRNASAVIPLVMSGVALATVLIHVLTTHDAAATDEGTAAHVFQLLFAGQAPFVAFFALKWLPRLPSEAMYVMAVQAGAALVALAPVVIFDL
ncbi:MAG TPA: hypothetical protein VIV63_10420 [Steroidobacteraceae bacterium]